MAEIKLPAACEQALKSMTKNGVITKELQWRWENHRYLLFTVIMQQLCPFFGFKPEDPDNKQEVQDAWKAWCEAVSDGYMVESSNGGKKFAAKGYCAEKPEASKPSSEFKL